MGPILLRVKVDFKKSHDAYRARRGEFRLVDVPPMQYLMVDGRGDPNTSQQYADALAALYPVAYTLKFASKRELDRDYVVPPLEALWWAADMAAFTTARDKSQWSWTAMIMAPDWVPAGMVDDAVAAVAAKDRPDCTRRRPPGDAARGPLRADAAHRAVRRRGRRPRRPARAVHP